MHKNVRRIILVRHGESIGNIDPGAYGRLPDHEQDLTTWGEEQAIRAGKRLRNILGSIPSYDDLNYNTSMNSNNMNRDEVDLADDCRFFISPYKRSHQTFQIMSGQLRKGQFSVVEDPRLREQDWGNFQDVEHMKWQQKERRRFGVFYYRFAHGESGADVYDRVSSFMETLCRDSFRSKPANYVLISHGITVRMFLARFYHWPVEIVNKLHNFYNGQMVILERCEVTKAQYTNVHLPKRKFLREPSFNRTSFLDENTEFSESDLSSYLPAGNTDSNARQSIEPEQPLVEAEHYHPSLELNETKLDLNPTMAFNKLKSKEICGTRFLLTSLLMSDPPGPPEQDICWERIEERKKTSSPLLGL